MSRITKFDSTSARAFQAEASAALRKLAAERGLDVKADGGAIASDTSAVFRFRFTVLDRQAVGDAERNAFCAYCKLFGLGLEHYKARFVANNGEEFELTGVVPSRPKFPLQGTRVRDGLRFKFTAAIIPKLLPRAAA